MKKVFLIFLVLIGTFTYSQTAKEIIDKNIEKTGGLTNWKLLNSVFLQGRVTLGVKDQYPVKIYQQRPNLTKTVITIYGKPVAVEGYDGKKGYAMNYATNKLQEFPNYKPESFDNDFIDWEKKGFTAKYLGKEKVLDYYCHKVELTKNVNKTYYYFETKTFMLLKEENGDETITYGDFKKTNGLVMPYRIESTSKQKESDYVLLINKIETNKEFPANTFKF